MSCKFFSKLYAFFYTRTFVHSKRAVKPQIKISGKVSIMVSAKETLTDNLYHLRSGHKYFRCSFEKFFSHATALR